MPTPKAYIFDLDGTLIDSLADIAESINRMLDGRGYPRCAAGDFTQMIGDGMEKLVERALPEEAREESLILICVEEYRAACEFAAIKALARDFSPLATDDDPIQPSERRERQLG